MKLEGSLDAFSLPDIFALLSMTKKSGGLHLRRAQAHGVVWFTTGAVTGGASDVTRQSLARRVAGAGCVDTDALRTAVEQSAADDGMGVVRALAQAGAVDEGVLHDLVGEHVVDTVFDLLRWSDGDFAFVVDEANPDDVGVSRQVDEVVTEARRRLEVWGGVATAIPSPQAVLTVQTTLDTDPQLTRDEWSLLALVDGRRTVAHIVGLAGRGEFAVVSALAELVGRGLLRLTDGDEVTALLRAQELLATLEAPVTTSATVPAADDEPIEPIVEVIDFLAGSDGDQVPAAGDTHTDTDTDDIDTGDGLGDDEDDEDDEEDDESAAAVTPLTSVPTQPGREADITPQRPDFLPRRRPEHPEEPLPQMAAVAGGAATAPAVATMIDRDPSVNKSLLLRLIAGVRGL